MIIFYRSEPDSSDEDQQELINLTKNNSRHKENCAIPDELKGNIVFKFIFTFNLVILLILVYVPLLLDNLPFNLGYYIYRTGG